MNISYLLLDSGDGEVLENVAPDVFDNDIDAGMAELFLDDPRHHIAVALDHGQVVGMATALDYLHPDKKVQFWINEVGVAPAHRRRGVGRRLVEMLLERGRSLGCSEAWVGTEQDNLPARALYVAANGGAGEPFVMYTFDLSAGRSTMPEGSR